MTATTERRKLLSGEQACVRLRCSASTLRRLLRKGEIQQVRVRGRVYYDAVDLAKLLTPVVTASALLPRSA